MKYVEILVNPSFVLLQLLSERPKCRPYSRQNCLHVWDGGKETSVCPCDKLVIVPTWGSLAGNQMESEEVAESADGDF